MDNACTEGRYLLIDAAGPVSIIGLVENGDWVERIKDEGDFLEWLQPAVVQLLADSKMRLEDLSGVYYGSGPGSTLGLRLAAMFIRTLLELPDFRDWRCFQYRNLELAICSQEEKPHSKITAAVAPWRKDKLHLSSWDENLKKFINSSVAPEKAVEMKVKGFIMGKRFRQNQADIEWLDYPLEKIPVTLKDNPHLLEAIEHPAPYTSEVPSFKKWESTRHSGK